MISGKDVWRWSGGAVVQMSSDAHWTLGEQTNYPAAERMSHILVHLAKYILRGYKGQGQLCPAEVGRAIRRLLRAS